MVGELTPVDALKFSDEPEPTVVVAARARQDVWHISIRDDGTAI